MLRSDKMTQIFSLNPFQGLEFLYRTEGYHAHSAIINTSIQNHHSLTDTFLLRLWLVPRGIDTTDKRIFKSSLVTGEEIFIPHSKHSSYIATNGRKYCLSIDVFP